MVNYTQTISQSVCRLFTSVLSNSEFIAISTPPWLCPLQFGGLSLLYTLYRLAGKYSEDDIEESSQVSVPIMTSGFVVSRSKSSSGFIFYFLSIENSS